MIRKNTCLTFKFSYKTYEEVYNNAASLGSSIISLNLAPKQKEHLSYEIGFVAIQSKNREEYQTIEIACALYGIKIIEGIVSLSVYDTLGVQAV